MRIALICITILLFCNCSREQKRIYTYTYPYLKNNTGHHICVMQYIDGAVRSTDTIRIVPGATFDLGEGMEETIISYPPRFLSKYFMGTTTDSIIVIFDNLYRVAHYSHVPPPEVAPKCYFYYSNRNIRNPLNYTFEKKMVSEYRQENTHIYTFTEQDYLDAAQ